VKHKRGEERADGGLHLYIMTEFCLLI